MTLKEKIIQTLHQAAPGLQQLQDDFFLFGSAASLLSDVRINNTHDLDILVSVRDAATLKTIWHTKKLDIQTDETDLFRSDRSLYRFEWMNMEVSGGLEVCKNGKWMPFVIYDYEIYPVGKLLVRIPTLEEQKNILRFFGREKDKEKIQLIEERIQEIQHKS